MRNLNDLLNVFNTKQEEPRPFYEMGPGVQQPTQAPIAQPVSQPKKQEVTVDSVLQEKIKQKPIEQKAPLAQVMPKIEREVAQIDAKTEDKPDLRKKLYSDLIEKYGMDKREELLAKFEEKNKGFNWAAFAGGLGTTLQGKGGLGAQEIVNMQRGAQKAQLEEFDKTKAGLEADLKRVDEEAEAVERKDPNSLLSKQIQQSLGNLIPGRDFSKFSAEQLFKAFPFIKVEADTIAARQKEAKAEREKQEELLKLVRGGDPVRMQIVQKAANEKERNKAFEEADMVKTAQQTINDLQELYLKAERGEIDRDTFSSLANTVLGNYRRIMPESDLNIKTFGGISKAVSDAFKSEGRFRRDDLNRALLGIQTLARDNAKTLNGLGIPVELRTGLEKTSQPAQPTQQVGGGARRVQSPSGQVRLIPADLVEAALAAGGKLVD
jgi:hypothetical protein